MLVGGDRRLESELGSGGPGCVKRPPAGLDSGVRVHGPQPVGGDGRRRCGPCGEGLGDLRVELAARRGR